MEATRKKGLYLKAPEKDAKAEVPKEKAKKTVIREADKAVAQFMTKPALPSLKLYPHVGLLGRFNLQSRLQLRYVYLHRG